jgi:hypothetical protein
LGKLLAPSGVVEFHDASDAVCGPWLDSRLTSRLDNGPRVRFARVETRGDERLAVLELGGRARAELRSFTSSPDDKPVYCEPLRQLGEFADRCDLEFEGELRWNLGERRAEELWLRIDFSRALVVDGPAPFMRDSRLEMRWHGTMLVRAAMR